MATIKSEFYRFNGTAWDIHYFKTSADMVEGAVSITGNQDITGYKKFTSLGVDTINGATHGNAILRQLSGGQVVIGSNLRQLRLTGNTTRPYYTPNDPVSSQGTELALLSDITGPTVVRERAGGGSLTSAASPIAVSGVSLYDTLMIEVNKYSGGGFNPKIVTVTVAKSSTTNSTDSDYICSWSTWNGTTERINSFNVAYSGGYLYFTDFKYVERNVSGSTMTYTTGTYTLYVGRIWKM